MMLLRTPSDARLGLRADLGELPLTAALELIHSTSQSGSLRVSAALDAADLPLELHFCAGEVTSAAILDWTGLDALYSFPQDVAAGQAAFWQQPTPAAPPLAPFQNLLGEWARLSDEWPRLCEQLFSPSQRFYGELDPFSRPGGVSARWITAFSGQPLHEVCAQLAALQQAGMIRPVRRSYEWDTLVLPPCHDPQEMRQSPVLRLLDGQKTLHRLIQRGLSSEDIRAELVGRVGPECLFPGSGRALRDWLWEHGPAQRELLIA
ncbi:DUF4388 domain-containing protein [Deinococcus sp. Marseille-Q6407]|uniref:DUF4388 domain-containing protein n=1 Tax=Deinococcus sp. Marseille-Q6407 TaxID=2969223 RepID=UPI0021BEE058|nr:DUF4388 domain-containing protein [Deinococcus sp. Marseille-Q6407]